MGSSFAEAKARRKPRTKTLPIALDEGVMGEIEELERAIEIQRRIDEIENAPNKAPRMQQRLDELRRQADVIAEDFTVQELPRPAYRALVEQHPDPTGSMRWNEDTFAPALLHATCTSHDWTLEEWTEAWSEWGSWAMYPLFACAYEVCEGPSKIPFGSGRSAVTPNSATSSEQPDGTDSPTPSS